MLIMATAPAFARSVVEVSAGQFEPLVVKGDMLETGDEVGVGLYASSRDWLQVGMALGYARLEGGRREAPTFDGPYFPETETVDTGAYEIYNLSFDARFGVGLEGPNQIWVGAGWGWCHLEAADDELDGESHYNHPIINTLGIRAAVGAATVLTDRVGVGVQIRYTYQDYGRDEVSQYLGGLQILGTIRLVL